MNRTPFRKSHGKITVVLYNKPNDCGGKCIYCFSAKGFTRSTHANEDTLIARNCGWDAACQLERRLSDYGLERDAGNKYDLAVKGDSFTTHDRGYLKAYVKACYDYLNGCASDNLSDAKNRQADALDKCATFKVETRPDYVDDSWCEFLMELGVTTVELGVQSLDDRVLDANRRGHGADATLKATRSLKKFGFEVVYQMMVGMVGSSMSIDERMLTKDLWATGFCPDAIKIYPCILLQENVAKHLGLAKMYAESAWKPLTIEAYVELLDRVYPHFPPYVHTNRIQRLFEPTKIAAGPAEPIDRAYFDGTSRCLWQRSVAQSGRDLDGDFSDYRLVMYPQEDGYCVAAMVDADTVIGYGRMSFRSKKTAVIRDVRVLGNMVPVGTRSIDGNGTQHIGVGRSLMGFMEELARSRAASCVELRPSVGTARYFERLGYTESSGPYFRKDVSKIREKSTCAEQAQSTYTQIAAKSARRHPVAS